jgi:ribosomal protein L11 methyltransferase
VAYYEFTINASGSSKEALLNKVSEMGSLGVRDHGEKIIAYFRDTLDIVALRDELNLFRKVLGECGLDPGFSFDYLYLAERDWNESWKKRFIPIDVGDKLSIIPPWETVRDGRIPLIIDPGMAFGTGHHETTKTCLMLIERYTSGSRGETFLDIGTGTGILAIAASKLGFASVAAVDIDPLAVRASVRNVHLNDSSNVLIKEGCITAVTGAFDMIAANLMSEVLIAIAPEIASRLNHGGIVLLSGMLLGQENDVLKAMGAAGIRPFEKVIDGRWISLILAR